MSNRKLNSTWKLKKHGNSWAIVITSEDLEFLDISDEDKKDGVFLTGTLQKAE